jgi:hypothetical protein
LDFQKDGFRAQLSSSSSNVDMESLERDLPALGRVAKAGMGVMGEEASGKVGESSASAAAVASGSKVGVQSQDVSVKRRTRHKLPKGVVKGKAVEQDVSSQYFAVAHVVMSVLPDQYLSLASPFASSSHFNSRIDGSLSSNAGPTKPSSPRTLLRQDKTRNDVMERAIVSPGLGKRFPGWVCRVVLARMSRLVGMAVGEQRAERGRRVDRVVDVDHDVVWHGVWRGHARR